MPDEFVAIREFEGFSKRIDMQFMHVDNSISSLHGKLDTLLMKGLEEAMMMGEIRGSITSINERLERLEVDSSDAKKGMKALWLEHNKYSEDKLKWWGQVLIVAIAAILGGVITKYIK